VRPGLRVLVWGNIAGGGEDDGCLEVRKVSDFKYEPNVDCVQK